jgi:hypothetical protein
MHRAIKGQNRAIMSVCINCNGEIPAFRVKRTKGTAKYCDPSCQTKYWKKRYAGQNTLWNLPSGTVGAINELRVGVDLLAKGYAVFRALSPSCLCDLVLLFDDRAFRVEVTTGHRSSSGKLYFPAKDPARYDVLAVVLPDSIVYSTTLPELNSLISCVADETAKNGTSSLEKELDRARFAGDDFQN